MPKDKGEKEMPPTKYRIQGLIEPDGKCTKYRVQVKFPFLWWWLTCATEEGSYFNTYEEAEQVYSRFTKRNITTKGRWEDV
jgi:hypothetical protein